MAAHYLREFTASKNIISNGNLKGNFFFSSVGEQAMYLEDVCSFTADNIIRSELGKKIQIFQISLEIKSDKDLCLISEIG